MSKLGFRRFAVRTLAAVAVLAIACHARPASAGYSSIVIDADTGRVLAQHEPDAQNYPASLTKMMTLYLTFKGLESGTLSLQQRFTVSAHAAEQAPSKLDLKPGETVPLHDLIFAVITHSANDAAVVIGENIAGSEPAFAQRMTAEAHALGMSHTNFANASGLPNPDNVTTARDLATLALSLYRDFPKEYPWFATEEFSFNGVSYSNHNHLMHSFPGMDGIKTGYIRASGFNLAASAVRDGHRLFAVVMGGESAHSRDLQMAALLNSSFARTGNETEVADDAAPEDAPASLAKRAIAAMSPVGKAHAATRTVAQPAPHARNAKAIDGWSIQVGAYMQRDMAEHAGELALQRIPAMKGRVVEVLAPSHTDKEQVYRARIVHFNHHEAELACRELHKKRKSCAVIAPGAAQQVAAN
ncbi:MAG TPA: D-alanyl-D-alanine carboxypeptidase family protein [Stellaceae bacterium]|nr:D-alanyl-D-alanine carboxypeptidase family protein [Stellaceae bacterium]